MSRMSMNVYAKSYAMDTKDVSRERINVSRLIEKTHEALQDKRTKMSRLNDAPISYRRVERIAPTIESVTYKTKFMNRSVKSVETEYIVPVVEQPKSTKRTIFVTIIKNKQIVQG